ncbi:MAG: TetR/AcrR family transcriptional regulator [Anaeromyxobacteraceae bacterium]
MKKGERTKELILDGALRLASELGLDGLSLGRLAEDLELSKSGLFAHFDSKEDLQAQMLDHAAERFTEVVVRPALEEPAGAARLRRLFELGMVWPRKVKQPGGCIFMAASAELDDRPGLARERLAVHQQAWYDTIARVVRSGQKAGAFRAGADADQAAFEFVGISLTWNLASRLLRDPRADEKALAAVDRLIEGLRAQS